MEIKSTRSWPHTHLSPNQILHKELTSEGKHQRQEMGGDDENLCVNIHNTTAFLRTMVQEFRNNWY